MVRNGSFFLHFAGVPFDWEQNCETFVNFGGTRTKCGGYPDKVRGGTRTKCEKKKSISDDQARLEDVRARARPRVARLDQGSWVMGPGLGQIGPGVSGLGDGRPDSL